ncbi:MAG: hypothetical protein IPG45_30620 [Deltaproteobacteria bacterium]|nr:hypothetical protein [Deltaproteobacteria bacterium]
MSLRACLFAAMSVGACGLDKPDPVPLIDVYAFQRLDVAADPFQDPLTLETPCDALQAEAKNFGGENAFDVDTDGCAHLAVSQPSLVPVYEGETMFLRVWHFELAGTAGDTVSFGVRIGDEEVLQRELTIPGPAGLDAPRWQASKDIPAGTPVYFHVRNHGSNSYALIELSVGGPFEQEEEEE